MEQMNTKEALGTASTQLSPLHETVKNLEHEIAMLAEVFGQMHRRLEPLTAQHPTPREAEPVQQPSGSSNVVCAIKAQCGRLQQIRIAMLKQVDLLEI